MWNAPLNESAEAGPARGESGEPSETLLAIGASEWVLAHPVEWGSTGSPPAKWRQPMAALVKEEGLPVNPRPLLTPPFPASAAPAALTPLHLRTLGGAAPPSALTPLAPLILRTLGGAAPPPIALALTPLALQQHRDRVCGVLLLIYLVLGLGIGLGLGLPSSP